MGRFERDHFEPWLVRRRCFEPIEKSGREPVGLVGVGVVDVEPRAFAVAGVPVGAVAAADAFLRADLCCPSYRTPG